MDNRGRPVATAHAGELTQGRVFTLGPREVTEAEIIEFATKYDPQPFHLDPASASGARWGGVIASGWMTCAIAMELVARHILAGSDAVGSPGVESLEWPGPVRPGDHLTLIVTILEARPSRSGKHRLVRWRWEGVNQEGAPVLRLTTTSLFAP